MHFACSWLVKIILCPLLDCANIPGHELEPSVSGFLMIPLSLKVSAPSPDSQASLPWIQTSFGNFSTWVFVFLTSERISINWVCKLVETRICWGGSLLVPIERFREDGPGGHIDGVSK